MQQTVIFYVKGSVHSGYLLVIALCYTYGQKYLEQGSSTFFSPGTPDLKKKSVGF